jgi:hypothetical protein
MKKFTFLFAALMACTAMFAVTAPETNEALWEEFQAYFNEYYPNGAVDPEVAKAKAAWPRATKTLADVDPIMNVWPTGIDASANIMTNENSRFKWLGDFIQEVSTGLGKPIDSEALWRASLQSFFLNTVRTSWPSTVDFTGVGDPAIWGPLYEANMPEPEVPSAVENTTVTVKAQKVMIDGQVYMVREGKTFNMLGQEVK